MRSRLRAIFLRSQKGKAILYREMRISATLDIGFIVA